MDVGQLGYAQTVINAAAIAACFVAAGAGLVAIDRLVSNRPISAGLDAR